VKGLNQNKLIYILSQNFIKTYQAGRFEVFTVTKVQVMVFWVVMPHHYMVSPSRRSWLETYHIVSSQ